MSLDNQAQREPGKIYFCLELSRRLRHFPAIPGAFELSWIEQSYIFPRRKKKRFQADLFFKRKTAEVNKLERKPGATFLAYFLSWRGRGSGSKEVWPWPEHSSKANGSRDQIIRECQMPKPPWGIRTQDFPSVREGGNTTWVLMGAGTVWR